MFYKSDFSFLCEVFRKCRIDTRVIEKQSWENPNMLNNEPYAETVNYKKLFESFEKECIYKQGDGLGRSYMFFLLPETPVPTVFAVGPYLSSTITEADAYEMGERLHLPPAEQVQLWEYLSVLPRLTSESHATIMLEVFCGRIWHGRPFSIVDISDGLKSEISHLTVDREASSVEDTYVSIKNMEKRYFFENEMIRAVSAGIPYADERFNSNLTTNFFEKRLADPLRNAKNYSIIMNTLLRKAAESGGVHPVHINEASSRFSRIIEEATSTKAITKIMQEMLHGYTHLVQKHSDKGCSELVCRANLIITKNLSCDLSLSSVAGALGVSPSYLSNAFHKEMGATITEYIREKRMRYAMHLLQSTSLQIQTVAMHCGIMDLQYFSKLFKRQYGLTPSECRRKA